MKQKLLKTMLLLLALVAGSSNVWAEEGDELAICQGTGSGYGTRRTLTDSHSVGWVLASSQSGYLGANSAANHNKVKPTDADLPVVKAVKSDATTSTTGYYFYYTTTAVANVGSLEFSYTANSGNSSATAYVVVGDAVSAKDGDAYEVIELSASTTTKQNASLGTSGTFTYTFSEKQTDARYYGFIIVTDSNKRLTAGTIKLLEGASGTTPPTITFNNGSVRPGRTLDLSTLFSSNSEGVVTYRITAGDSYASLDGSTLTGTGAGEVTVEASQAAAGIYAAGNESATITVTAKTPSSISITTAPTKTTYTEGQFFDPTGMVVTATFTDDTSEDVTDYCTYSPSLSTALESSDTEVTITYTENAVNKTTTQAITVVDYQVLPFTWAGGTTSTLTALAGVTASVDATDYKAGNAPYYQKMSAVDQYIKIHVNEQPVKVYVDVKMIGGATTSKIKIQECDTEDGTYTDVEELTISGAQNTVLNLGTINPFKATTRFVKIIKTQHASGGNIGVGPIKITNSEAITISSAGYTTYVPTNKVSFPAGLTAYIATTTSASSVTLAEKESVPAKTPIILEGAAGNYTLPVLATDPESVAGNLLQASTGSVTGDGSTIFALGKKDDKVGFYLVKSGVTVPAGKAYLVIAAGGAKEFLNFDFGEDDATAINEVGDSESVVNGPVYDLSGRRVQKPTKGLYIVNGKKVMF